ncbi:MAG: proprotein convertase P-domain-containing protein [Bdellovibrionales bacterium]
MKRILYGIFSLIVITACGTKSETQISHPKNNPNTNSPSKDTPAQDPSNGFRAKVIYGSDDRKDLYQLKDSTLLALADSTVSLIATNDLKENGNVTEITTTPYGTSYSLPLCANEPFREQDTAAFCSGFLVAPNIIVTAGHCVRNEGTPSSDCSTTKFVFGFDLKNANDRPQSVPNSEVYSCKHIIKSQLDNSGADFSVIELDRPVTNHRPLNLRRESAPTTSDTLIVIGHPSGLPTKVAGNGKIRNVFSSYIRASLDTYGGNSGSSVFNADTHEVEGVLVRGEEDFVAQNGCMLSKQCAQDGCRGEDVTRISEVLPYLPSSSQTPPPKPPAISPAVQYSSKTKLVIPDNSTLGVTSSVLADQSPNGRKVSVQVNITHTWRGDLIVNLIAPDGTTIPLANRSGGSTDNIIGTYGVDLIPTGDLTKLSKLNMSGLWILKVSDRAAFDVGALNSWTLSFK